LEKTRVFNISKHQVVEAFRLVKVNAGSAGIDGQSISEFESNLKKNLYKIWNRMSSGSYFPPPVMAVEIPKKSGGVRVLGIPTVSDRVAQMVAKLSLEPIVEPIFLEDSYGYRPHKSALDAIEVTRKRCWRINWVLEFDIKGLFDNIPHDLILKAVKRHTKEKWLILYIERWLKSSIRLPNGEFKARSKGTPQGGVISPILSNLFLHYTFDKWMKVKFPKLSWCRYADDGLVHCFSEKQAEYVRTCLEKRFIECGIEMHPDKTKIVYCKDDNRKENYHTTSFDFLGYTFRARRAKSEKHGTIFTNFSPAVSKSSIKAMRAKIRSWNMRKRMDLDLKSISRYSKPVLQGWLMYYGKYHVSALEPVWTEFNRALMMWTRNKYKKLKSKKKAGNAILNTLENYPDLFPHWKLGNGKMLA
jgi:group II intron reverse transcriptase/maturase